MKIAFVGLGNMGLPMAINLLKAGYEMYGLNRSKGKEQAFREAGGQTGYTLAELSRMADVVMTCLPLPQDVEQVFLGDNGVLSNGKSGLVLINFSTVSPDLNLKIAAEAQRKGMDFLDAPVSGGTFGAESGTLSIMVGGDRAVFDRVYPLFQVLGSNIYHTGPVGSGTMIKLLNQYMVGMHTLAVSEAMVLADKLGVDKGKMFEILNASYAQSRIFERHYRNFISQDVFKAGFALKLLHKDMTLVHKMAEESGIDLPGERQVTTLLGQAKDSVHGEEDMAAMYLFMKERQSGIHKL